MLLFGKKLTARQAEAVGLVSEVFPEATYQKELQNRLQNLTKLPPKVMTD